MAFTGKGTLWQQRRELAREFWPDRPDLVSARPAEQVREVSSHGR
jgi:hypothetical protein